jgi:uncharacterized membrane protein YdcZ (DUF606 family)
MEYINLVFGIILLTAFTWILVKNSKRTGFLHSLFRFDTIVGIIAGLYLTLTSAISLLSHLLG